MTTIAEAQEFIKLCSTNKVDWVDSALQSLRTHLLDTLAVDGSVLNVFPTDQSARIPHGHLCRCRGMIQDINSDTSLFLASPEAFFDGPTSSSGSCEYLESTMLYVVPVPGNDFYYPTTSCPQDTGDRKRNAGKRPWDAACPTQNGERSIRSRRSVEREQEVTLAHNQPTAIPKGGVQGYLNLPHLPTSQTLSSACIVTVIHHQGNERNKFRLNQVYDFYGYLSRHPFTQSDVEDELESFQLWHAESLSMGLVSRLTCVGFLPIDVVALLPRMTLSTSELRGCAVGAIAQHICMNDRLLAEYLLLHLCSRVEGHHSEMPIGDLPLLIVSPMLDSFRCSEILRCMVPIAEVLIDDRSLRDGFSLSPHYSVEENYLKAGMLQVSEGTHITIDCRNFTDELLETVAGIEESLFAAIHKQIVMVDYVYHKVEVPLNGSIMAVTDNDDSLPAVFRFPLRVMHEPHDEDAAAHAADSDYPSLVRTYLGRVHSVSLNSENNDDDHLEESISSMLVRLSQEFETWNNRDALLHNNSYSMMIALIRTTARSWGRPNISRDDLLHAENLERQRMQQQLASRS